MTINKKVRFEELFPIIEETISAGNQFSFCAFGKSMLPFIRDGKDTVTLGPVVGDVKSGDVIFYRRDNKQFVLHRVIRVREDGTCDLCGDNQYIIEKGVRPDQIIAILVRLERNGKEIRLHSPSVRIRRFFLPLRRFILHVKSAVKRRILQRNH